MDGDGWQDLFVANVDNEMFALYRNNHDESFSDVANGHGIGQATRLLSGWGLKFFDFDNDGLVDLFLANGHPDDMADSYGGQVRYKEPLLLFRNDGTRLRDVSAQVGPVFAKSFPARGLAVGDYDNDGAVDVLVGNNGGAPLLLRNRAAAGRRWVGLKLEGKDCNRDAIGAHHLVGGRRPTVAAPQRGRQLPLVARPARGNRPRFRDGARLAGDPVAQAQRTRGADQRRAHRPVPPHRGRTRHRRLTTPLRGVYVPAPPPLLACP